IPCEVLDVDLSLVQPFIASVPPVAHAGVDADGDVLGDVEALRTSEASEVVLRSNGRTHINRVAAGWGPRELPEAEVLAKLARELAEIRTERIQERGRNEARIAAEAYV